jgi:hypothetical protein
MLQRHFENNVAMRFGKDDEIVDKPRVHVGVSRHVKLRISAGTDGLSWELWQGHAERAGQTRSECLKSGLANCGTAFPG